MKAIDKIIEFIVETRFENIPSKVVEKAKQPFTDIVGLTLAGSALPASKIAADFVRETGGTPKATVIGAGFKSSEPNAAFANGISAHVNECDDADFEILCHPSVTLGPTVLAVGEGGKASGRDVIEAYIIGWEVIGAIGRGAQPQLNHMVRGWHTTGTIGSFGATAAAAKLLKLDGHQVRMALGINLSQAAGSVDQFGTMGKGFNAGHAARNGIVAAMLAKKGFTADDDALESRKGFFNLYNGEGNYDASKVAPKPGNPYTFVSPGALIKKYACGAPFQVPLETMQGLVKREKFTAEDVESIEVGISRELYDISFHGPPQRHLEAKVNEEYPIAAGIVYPDLIGLAAYEQERIADPRVQELMRKIKVYLHPELTKGVPVNNVPVHFIQIKLKDGRKFSLKVDTASGFPGNPMSQTDLLAKYRDCATRVLSSAKVEQSIKMLTAIEELKNIGDLIKVLNTKS